MSSELENQVEEALALPGLMQQAPAIPLAPMATNLNAELVPDQLGNPWVRLSFTTPLGQQHYHFTPDVARTIAKTIELLLEETPASSGLIIPPPGFTL